MAARVVAQEPPWAAAPVRQEPVSWARRHPCV